MDLQGGPTFEDLSIDDDLSQLDRVVRYSASAIALQRLVHVKVSGTLPMGINQCGALGRCLISTVALPCWTGLPRPCGGLVGRPNGSAWCVGNFFTLTAERDDPQHEQSTQQ